MFGQLSNHEGLRDLIVAFDSVIFKPSIEIILLQVIYLANKYFPQLI